MKIKAKVSEDQKKWILEQEQRYKNALINEVSRHKKEMADIQSRLDSYVKFWEENEKPIKPREKKRVGGGNFHETVLLNFVDENFININTLKPEGSWVCKFCLGEVAERYISCGDSRYDQTYSCCDCRGAKIKGKPWNELI